MALKKAKKSRHPPKKKPKKKPRKPSTRYRVVKEQPNSSGIRVKMIDTIYTDLVDIFKKHTPNVREILLLYGNLGYCLGASIGGYTDKGPSEEKLKQLYYAKPTVCVALMIQGLQTTSWVDDLDKTIEEIKKETINGQTNTI